MQKLIGYTFALLSLAVSLALSAHADPPPRALADHRPARGEKDIAEAWLADPTTRYKHFVLGANYEAASLMARLRDGRTLTLTLPDTEVFEDREPRLADLDGDGRDEIILVRSHVADGASLVVAAVRDGGLKILAETPPTGRPNTWRNPAGIADFDGDGRLDIAEVQMPHVLGKLRVWTLRNGALVEIATASNVSNHAIGSPHIRLAAIADVNGDGRPDLIIPSLDRHSLRVFAFMGGQLREIARKPLVRPVVRNITVQDVGKLVSVLIDHGDTATTVRFSD